MQQWQECKWEGRDGSNQNTKVVNCCIKQSVPDFNTTTIAVGCLPSQILSMCSTKPFSVCFYCLGLPILIARLWTDASRLHRLLPKHFLKVTSVPYKILFFLCASMPLAEACQMMVYLLTAMQFGVI
jgi:hypothetical protein